MEFRLRVCVWGGGGLELWATLRPDLFNLADSDKKAGCKLSLQAQVC